MFFLGNQRLVGEQRVEEGEAHRRLVVLGVLLRGVELGEVAHEEADILDRLVNANVVADRLRRDRRLRVRRDLDAAQLRQVKPDDRRERRVDLLVDRVATSVLVVVGGRAVHSVQRVADVAHHLVNDIGGLVDTPHVVGHRQAVLLFGKVLDDVVVDLVGLVSLHVDREHVVPDVRVAAVLGLLLEDLFAADLVDVTLLRAHDDAVRLRVVKDRLLALLEREGVGVFDRAVAELVGVVGGCTLGCLVAREHVEEHCVVVAELLGVVHDVVVLVVDKQEAVGLVGREVLDEFLAGQPDCLVEHLAVRLGRVEVAREVDVRDGRGAEEPQAFVVVDVDHRPFVRFLDAVGLLCDLDVLLAREALGDLVGERDDDVLAARLGHVDDHAARLLVQVLEVGDVGALVSVVEEDERLGLEDGLHLEHRVKLVGLEVVLEAVLEGDVLFLEVGLDDLEHLGDVGEVGRVHFSNRLTERKMCVDILLNCCFNF